MTIDRLFRGGVPQKKERRRKTNKRRGYRSTTFIESACREEFQPLPRFAPRQSCDDKSRSLSLSPPFPNYISMDTMYVESR